jgi:hypothetical protein
LSKRGLILFFGRQWDSRQKISLRFYKRSYMACSCVRENAGALFRTDAVGVRGRRSARAFTSAATVDARLMRALTSAPLPGIVRVLFQNEREL